MRRVGQIGVEFPLRGNHPGPQKFGHHVDQARAADPLRFDHADGQEHGFVGNGIDAKIFQRPGGGAHPVLDPPAFKRRARRTGRGHHPFGIPDDNFAVGTDVDVQGQGFALVNPRAQHPRDDIPPHVRGDRWESIEMNVISDLQPDLPGPDRRNIIGDRGVGRFPDVFGVEPQEEMGHNRISGRGHVRDPARYRPPPWKPVPL